MTPDGSDAREDLLRRWQADGDVEALDALLRDEVSFLKRRIQSHAGDQLSASTSAEDLAQEAVFKLLRVEAPPSFEKPAQLRAYLWKAAWRLLVDHLRRRGVSPLESARTDVIARQISTSGGLGAVDRRDDAAAVRVALHLLADDERAILDMAYFQGLGATEIAHELGIERGAASMRLVRAKRALLERLSGWVRTIG